MNKKKSSLNTFPSLHLKIQTTDLFEKYMSWAAYYFELWSTK